ncbi:choline dehydrogenase 7 [Coelomomyces lativittatus]|nr:choline dehydrogenase 7 [Coelomomyces lativittatus]
MTRCLDILSDYLRGQNHSFERIDGNIRGPERQAAIDRFSAPNSDIFAFLLCTRAGGVGINLTAADTAIIFDSDWNPQNDLQAQARCHRIGQTKPVKVYRLITMNTYEQEMFDRAGLKLGLDKAVLQKMDANGSMGDDASLSSSENSNSASRLSKKEIEELLKKGAYGALLDESESKAFCEEDIEQILNKRTTVIKHDNANAVGSIFSKATFISSQASNELNVNDPLFWDKFAEKAHLQPLHPEKVEVQEDLEVPRQRRSQVRAYEQMRETYDDVEMDNPVEMALKWSPTEKLYFERRLMVFGLYNWEKLHEACPRRSILDLKVCARDLVRFLISKLNPVDDYQMAVDCESVVAEECDPYCNPFGDPLPYENANLRQVIEYKSFFLNAPKEYLETVERKAKFMLARIQLLKQVHDIVPADLKLAKQLYIPPITRPPAEWWGPEEDRDLMIGTLKHGYHLFRPMRTDTDLVFCKREYDPRTFQEHVTNGELPIYDNNEEVFMNGNDGLASNQNQTRSKRSESEDEEEELECEEEDIENTHLSNSTSMGEGSTKETILYAWPSKSELGSRLRRIVAAVLREKRKSAAAAAAAATVSAANANVNGGHRGASPSEKTDVNGNDTGKSQDINSTPNSKVAKWNKRERTDFFRTLCTYGVVVQPEPNQDKVDWSHLKELAGIPYKADTLLTEMYNHMVAMCKFLLEADIAKLTGATCMRPAEKFDGDEEYTLDKAKKLFKRIEFMEYLRNHVLTFQYLDTVLSQAKRTPGLPDWWQSGTHDRALLFGIAKHGYGRYESLVQDPEFNFYYMAESYRKEDVDMEGKIHILGLPWPKETIINKRIETLCLLAAPRHKWKQDPSQYTPPAYSPPQLIPVPTIVSSLHAQHELSTSAINIPKRLSPRANVTIEAWNHDGVQKKMTFTLPWGIHPSSSEEDESEACLSAVAQFLLDRIHSKRSERKPPTQEETPSKPTSPPQTLTTPSSGSLSATPALSNVSITSPPSASSTSTPGLPLKIRIRPFPSSNSISPSSESSPSSIFLHGKDSVYLAYSSLIEFPTNLK